MSTIKVNSIKNTATNDGGIAIDNSGHVQIDGQQFPSIGALSNRNIIDNPKMEVAQRGTSVSGLVDSPAFIVDRWGYRRGGSWGTNSFTMSQETSGPPDGFSHYLRLTQSGTAGAVPTSNTFCSFNQRIEARNTFLLNNGTTGTKEFTVSWYARGSRPGTYCMAFGASNSANSGDANYVCEYTLTTSWQRFTHTIPAQNVETFGSIATPSNRGADLHFMIAADAGGGGNIGGATAGSWHSADQRYTDNQEESFASTAGATFDITGVQVELGGVATPFEHEPHSVTLAKCQRYYFRVDGDDADGICHGYCQDSNTLQSLIQFPNSMRAAPTSLEQTGTASDYSIGDRGSDHTCTTAPTFINATKNAARFYVSSTGNLSAGDMGQVRFNAAGKFLAFPAEL